MSQIRSIYSIPDGLGLRGLRAVLAVAELGSFRRAAEDLGYTQSALSHQIATIEKALDRALFTRPGGRGQVRLTPAGEAVTRSARKVLAEVEAVAAASQEAGSPARVRIAVSQTTAAEVMPAALQLFRVDHPRPEVQLVDLEGFEAVASAIGRGRLELGFAHDPVPDDRVEATAIVDDPWAILTRRDSHLAEVEHPSFAALDGQDVVAWHRRWPSQVELEEAWARGGIAPRIVYRSDDNLALQRLVAAGLGHACIGRLAARRAIDPSLTWLSPRETIGTRRIFLCFPKQRPMNSTVVALMSAIRAQASV
ncbi:MAG TPA: LysR family transcriptional regulator [Acidimicrobiales bacterium]|jgi:DNA-binding transcriptional LysR family regulator|nr:LysR family transcriptional regulator [Acidimicrobiales bacterium]